FLRSRMRTYATRDLISGFNQVFGFFFGIIEGSVLLTVILLLLHVQPFVSVSHMLHESVINTVLSPLVLDGVRYMRLKM
ncbi:CvpA family protein, partial [Treponema pallidum]